METASVFTDRMVLQQGVRVPVWGRTAPDLVVTVRFAGQEVLGVADATGRWMVHLNPLIASRASSLLEVTDSVGGCCTFSDVLVGEVWVCSGQSNMEWPVVESNDGAEELQAGEFPCIRLFTVPRHPSAIPQENVQGTQWCASSPETVARFSAVGYFFARELHRRLNVPIGLINSSLGGTFAEAWTSREGLLGHPSLQDIVEKFEVSLSYFEQRKSEWQRGMAALESRTKDIGNTKFAEGWADLDDPVGDWPEMELPGLWQSRGLNHSGVVWFRKIVELPVSWAGCDVTLSIGATDKSDISYFNNEQIGSITMEQRSDAWSLVRSYTVPGRLVRPGRNVVAVRVHSDKYGGGMTGPATTMKISSIGTGEPGSISLAGSWKYAVEANFGVVQLPQEPVSADHQNAPSALFNGMIAPLARYAIRGAIWYQGESNADYDIRRFYGYQGEADFSSAEQYQILFPILIRDWRQAWGQGDFPFYFVQLANFMACKEEPSESTWAQLREAQGKALALPHTGMAIAIDIGDADDIHPRNKRDVGLRLAWNALNQTYGLRDVTPCGPVIRLVTRDGSFLRCSFDFIGGGLFCPDRELRGFAIAGADRLFVWAVATMEGEQIVLNHPQIPVPVAVRYAWADNPEANLFNSAGLPASPFQAQCN